MFYLSVYLNVWGSDFKQSSGLNFLTFSANILLLAVAASRQVGRIFSTLLLSIIFNNLLSLQVIQYVRLKHMLITASVGVY